MAENLSNEFALNLTLNDVISESYELLQTIGDGESITGGLFNRALKSMNIMLKLWESQGIHLWTMTEGSLFLKVGQAAYDYRNEGFEGTAADSSAVHLANEFVQVSVNGDVLAGVSTVVLADGTDVPVGGQIGFLNDTNDLDWYIVMEKVLNTIVLSRVLDNDIADGALGYTYTYFNATLLDGPVAPAAVLIPVADTTIFSVGDSVYIHLTDDTTDERIIASIDPGVSVSVTVGVTSATAAFEVIMNITTRRDDAFRPVKRIPDTMAAVRRRESTDYEIPIVFTSRDDYFGLPNKNQNGTPIQAYYDRQLPQGVMYLWNPPGSARSIINFTYEREIMMMDQPDQTFDLPADWYDAVTYGLAKRLIPKVGCSAERKVDITTGAGEYLEAALAFDQAVYPIRLKPQKYG